MPTQADFDRHRESLLRKMDASHLDWYPVKLAGSGEVLVSKPVRIDDYYVPVTPLETFAKGRQFGAYPLTRAVADQAHMQSVQIVPRTQAILYDFYTSSDWFLNTFYRGPQLCSGAHKLWILSARGIGINYGFYLERNLNDVKSRFKQYLNLNRGGKYLSGKDYTLIQGAGAAHDVTLAESQMKEALKSDFADKDFNEDHSHWDYSQLLQLMKPSGDLTIADDKGVAKTYSLAEALVSGLAPVWDEQPMKPHPKALRLAGLTK
jgi:hypothetical protein